ncbi:polysaccharide ABC transporter ATP-binding protein [Brumimicrobium sp.]|uniref:ABC transporter ATP-binding protein n=1 Tax=Brumimicrobium sp. TaxID=2029867 RepID=UPI003A8F7616
MTLKQRSIIIEGVSKEYTIGKQKDSSLRHALTGLFKSNKGKQESFWALKNVSFHVDKGEIIGVIGRNGAGKSTLLKVLSKITQPTEGRIEINGRVASLLEVGTGFHPELTGRENIYLNGTLLGMTRKEVAEKLEEIVEFSGVRKFIDTPVKHYSSGMYVRLAFSVAAHLEPEILIIDEVLAVGDAEFQKKCLGKMEDVAGEGRTVIFVSHDLVAVKKLCTRGIVLQEGEITFNGIIDEAIKKYNEKKAENKDFINPNWNKDIDYDIKSILIKNEFGKANHNFDISDKIYVEINFHINKNPKLYDFYLCVKRQDGLRVFSINKKINKNTHTFIIDKNCLTRGSYTFHLAIQIPYQYTLVSYFDVGMFSVVDDSSELTVYKSYDYGATFGKYEWK